jgi:hypothetical protein
MGRATKIFIIVAAVVVAVMPLPRGAVERVYARGVYPLLQPRLTMLTNSTTFAWFDLIVLLVVGSLGVMWIVGLRRRHGRALATIGGLALDTAAMAAVLYLWFLLAWGLNYRREPLSAQMDYAEDRVTREAVRALAIRTTESLNLLYEDAHASRWPALTAVPALLAPAFGRAQQDLAMTWHAAPGLPKRSLLNFYFTRVSIDGMTNPFLLETLANQSLLPFERPATVAHEWGHLAGYADESEANFVGWLVCMRGPAAVQYSGWLSLYGTVMNALPRGEREELVRALEQGPRDDLRAIAERIRRQTVPMARRAGYALYDRFLKANRVEAGIRSYSQVIRLLLGTKFAEDGAPVMRAKG